VEAASKISCDVAIAGGGLAGGLIALALAQKRPDLDVRLIEAAPTFGGNHLWSFFDSDIAVADRWLIEPLICHSWQGYDIRFPAHVRTVDARYNSIESEQLDHIVRSALGKDKIIIGRVKDVNASDAMLSDGRTVSARHVIDARGRATRTRWRSAGRNLSDRA
jgi:lycopene beta-cyclase